MSKTASETVGAQVKALREAREWSQAELARQSGVDQSLISRLEAGPKELKLSSLDRIAAAFGITTAELLTGPEPARKVAG